MGCGNGRDSYLFSQLGHSVLGIDYAFKPRETFNASFLNLELKDLLKENRTFDVIYSRFFLHSISNKEIIEFVKWSKGLFMAEFRVKGDKPTIFSNHERNLIDIKWLEDVLRKNSFHIKHSTTSREYAKYLKEKPLIGRTIAEK